MTGEDRRLVALVAVLAPAHAGRLLARLGGAGAEAARRDVEHLAAQPRRVRLAALAKALAEAPTPAPQAASPLLRRLELEARLVGSAGRTPVRGTDGRLLTGP